MAHQVELHGLRIVAVGVENSANLYYGQTVLLPQLGVSTCRNVLPPFWPS
jgi:hypothetical protein